MNTETQYLGIACLVPRDNFLNDNIGIIDNDAERIFGNLAQRQDSVFEDDVCQVVYRIQKPILPNAKSLSAFFKQLNEFLKATEDFSSYFFNEQEVNKNNG